MSQNKLNYKILENTMKGLKKIALVTAIAAASTVAQAELKAMDDSAMSVATGQAGITIDVNDFSLSIGEIQYKDSGSIFINNFKLGGAGIVEAVNPLNPTSAPINHHAGLDNLRVEIDVIGAGGASEVLWGLNKVVDATTLASVTGSYTDATAVSAANPFGKVDTTSLADYSAATTVDPLINDGDLVIGLNAQDQNTAVDMGFIIGGITLGDSNAVASDGFGLQYGGANTVLLANTALGGGIGPIDIVIDGQNGGMNINAYFSLKGSIELPFIATKFGFALHNTRGNDSLIAIVRSDAEADAGAAGTYELSGAHFQGLVEADADSSKGLHVVIQDFSGDMDITGLTFGDAPAIGDVFITDLAITADLNIYGH